LLRCQRYVTLCSRKPIHNKFMRLAEISLAKIGENTQQLQLGSWRQHPDVRLP
jgi:hypothetical protein